MKWLTKASTDRGLWQDPLIGGPPDRKCRRRENHETSGNAIGLEDIGTLKLWKIIMKGK